MEFQNSSHMLYFFSVNFHLMSLFIDLSLEKYSRPVDLSILNIFLESFAPLRPQLRGSQSTPTPQLYLLNPRKLNIFDKMVVILSALRQHKSAF